MTSTCDSAESIATLPPESDLDDEQIRNMLASPLCSQEREASADRSRAYHSFRENSSVKFISLPRKCRETCRNVLTQRKSSQETLSDREGISPGHQPVQRKDETSFRFSDPEEAATLVLEEQRDHLLAEAKSEIFKQECKVDSLNTCIREFQRQAHSNLLEMDYVKYRYEESRREQARLHEELAQREKALRDTRIRNIHEVEELKRAQEMRIDEFSRNELRESHATLQELTSQLQELQERMNCMNDSRDVSRCRIDLQWKIIPRSQSTGNRSKSLRDAEPRPKSAT